VRRSVFQYCIATSASVLPRVLVPPAKLSMYGLTGLYVNVCGGVSESVIVGPLAASVSPTGLL
jgi:hypothetical protein